MVEKRVSNQEQVSSIVRETLVEIAKLKDECQTKFLLIEAADRLNTCGSNYSKILCDDGQIIGFRSKDEDGEILTFEELELLANGGDDI